MIEAMIVASILGVVLFVAAMFFITKDTTQAEIAEASYTGLANKKRDNKSFKDPLDGSRLGVSTEDVKLTLNGKRVGMRVNSRNAKILRRSGFNAFPQFRRNVRTGVDGDFFFFMEDAIDIALEIMYLMELFEDYDEDYYPEFEVYDETFEPDWEPEPVLSDVEPAVEVAASEYVRAEAETVEAETPAVEEVAPSEPEPIKSVEPATPVDTPSIDPEPVKSQPSYSPPEPTYTPDPTPSYDDSSYRSSSFDSGGSSFGGGSSYDSGGSSFDSGGSDF